MNFPRIAALCAALVSPAFALADSPFNGKNLDNWKRKAPDKGKWVVGKAAVDEKSPNKLADVGGGAEMINLQPGSDLISEAKYGDCTIEVEFMVPKGSNSGIYLMGEYEVQVLDSFGKPDDKLTQGDLGALYSAAAPKVNASKKPGEWQKFVIDFQAPKFEGTKKIANAKFIKVTLNDVVLHENVPMKGATPGGLTGKEIAEGPIMFQGDHGPVAYRNLKVTPRK
jgi:hypothetical protein